MADKASYMIKEGGNFKTWRKRWFVLKDNVLYYSKYKNSGDLGIILLGEVHPDQVQPCTKKRKNCFEIRTPNRTYFLVLDNESEMNSWIDAIKGSITRNLKPAQFTEKKIGIGDFDPLKIIGKGPFGQVIQVRKKDTEKIYAMKVLNKNTTAAVIEVDHMKTEKNILQKLAHPFLTNVNYSFNTEDKVYFLMDFVGGRDLSFHLQQEHRFSLEKTTYYCAEIVLGLEYLHNSGVIYRDLKPRNILLTEEGHIVLTDFGIPKEGLIAEDTVTAAFCGTPEYLGITIQVVSVSKQCSVAPEVLENKSYTKAADWWSVGTLMYEMLMGKPPFYSQDLKQILLKIANTELKLDNLTTETTSILTGLLQRDPQKRLTDASVIKAHPYFKTIHWDALLKKEVKPHFIPMPQVSTTT